MESISIRIARMAIGSTVETVTTGIICIDSRKWNG